MSDGPCASCPDAANENQGAVYNSLPLVSVVIGNWNRLDDLKRAVGSVRKQVWPPERTEIVVVDNQSTDGSIEWCRDQEDIRLIITRLDLGASVMLDTGFMSSKGDYVVCMDNDAELDPTYIANAITIFGGWDKGINFFDDTEMAPEITDYVNRGYKLGCLTPNMMKGDRKTKDLKAGLFREEMFDVNLQFHGAACVFKREAGDKVGWYNPDYYLYDNEVDLGARLFKAGYLTMYCPMLVAYHHISNVNRVRPRLLYYAIRHYYWFIWEHLPFHLAVYQTLLWAAWSVMSAWRYPKTLIMSHLSAWIRMPWVFIRRQPITDEFMMKPWRPNIRKEFNLARWWELIRGEKLFGTDVK